MGASLYVDSRCTLGEGPCWSTRRQALVWTDIDGRALWQHTIADGRTSRWLLTDRVGALAECESGSFLLGFAKRLCLARLTEGNDQPAVFTDLVPVEPSSPSTRINDGRTDRSGNFVFGTLNEDTNGHAVGGFYQFSIDRGLRRLALPPVVIPNSICFSPDGGTMYFCDSPARVIQQADYDAEQAQVTRIRPFVQFSPHQGLPDGSVVDSSGCVWNAEWGAGIVRQYTPDGQLASEVVVPAKNPTCPVFGGMGLAELFVTSSRHDMSPDELERVPQAGGVYRVFPGAVGIPDPPFKDL
jgi:sugar lactone lactonase YvrE